MDQPLAENLRKAIENLIDAKLHDAISRPGGVARLVAHRSTGVASYDIRLAEKRLQESLAEVLSNTQIPKPKSQIPISAQCHQ